ncbi:MAG: type II/IV secretion system protein, partial [Planctomycetota bacterium]|nr:type II/IV secretion system protein [Planctomycetota bacterium]
TQCTVPYQPAAEDLPADFPYEQYISSGQPMFRAVGCRACRQVGYSGRAGIYELLVTSNNIRHLAQERVGTWAMKQAAQDEGMVTLRQDGWTKVLHGRTTVDEVLRVTKGDLIK